MPGRGSTRLRAVLASLPRQTSVLVVGAGPTGLLLAGELQRRGVPNRLIDARAEALHWDRATVIHPLSLEIFEALGLVDRFLAAGCRQRRILIHADGQRLGELDLAECGSRYGFNLGLSEEVTEAILTDHLEGEGARCTAPAGSCLWHPTARGRPPRWPAASRSNPCRPAGWWAATACAAPPAN